MKKYLTLLNGEGSDLIITDTGLEKISTAFLFNDSMFEYLYLETVSKLLFQPNTYHIESYELVDLNETIEEPFYPLIEALILFNQEPKLGVEYVEKIRKKFNFPVTYDYIDYYILSSITGFNGGDTPLSWDNLTTYNDKPILLLNGYSHSTMYDILTFIEEQYSNNIIDSYIINMSSFYPVDFYALNGEVYKYDVNKKKLKSIGVSVKDIEKENLFRYKGTKTIIMLSPHEMLCTEVNHNNEIKESDCYLENFTIKGEQVIFETDKGSVKLKSYYYKGVFSKLMNNHNFKKFIKENFDAEEDYIKVTLDHVIPYRFDGDFNPLMITYKHTYKGLKTHYTRNYLYSVINIEL